MGHRLIFNNTPQVSETDRDQGWNHPEQPYMPIARGISESSSVVHPVDNMPVQGVHFPSQWPPAPRSSGYPSANFNGELPQYQPMAPGPSHDPFMHQSAPGNIHMFQNNYMHRPPSSNISGQTIPGADGGFYNQTMAGGRGSYKRKSPGIPPICERGSTSRYYDVGSSSDVRLPADPWQEKPNNESYHPYWEYQPSYGVNGLSIGGEGTVRNVRSRAAVDRETNVARAHLSSNSLHHPSSRSSDQCNSVEFWSQSTNAPREWNSNIISPATSNGAASGSDPSFLNRDPSSLNVPNTHPNSSLEIGGYNNDATRGPGTVNNHVNPPFRGMQSGYSQRSAPTFQSSSSAFRPGHVAPSDDGQQVVSESYHSRHPRIHPNLRLHNVERSTRTFPRSDRYRYYNEEENIRDRWTPEGLVVVDHSAYYGSRAAMLDHYRDMRLDIDNMSYEELLALGERIGSVSTGLSDGLISKCLTESIYCSSDLSQDEGTCVICLEEYKNLDDVGTLKVCGHDFHVGCIQKWLSMKNSCPICKAAAVDDKMKDKTAY
ncbi:probable E3 ubiquitin-protein ligase ZFP1 [Andrographis paniculata]|uniref:probable E3 ubiquitin-protein ligase ZFP1 n=1 Tax=Andrographis paniculata TaxID=175694 RepID=UPI0021E93D7D|nr:probable E3 ubiquitin-protein ligase ZFP1 [Andrographis paniculata]XP_051132299.1 probable E3 ubiquitin-protein ligase ZFP1 [Andrographis paniculata]XP_051132300.1 probable E3 ubiquitin-protein ligase ZFP1 [Andrographis paniculata]XP_051132301.1 probable E3 ubiquitin-protein ligase ZFP1 [Andrographis paniculata]XP_051132302.1 probable E3 ubiquitin-protein ligase ZFP1 [Andrographis paniculata]XP_051132303.1 probable E3 ubiquitin-protein ligase ZFP1 [Andrographis paniculata]XP_051132305.1 pr